MTRSGQRHRRQADWLRLPTMTGVAGHGVFSEIDFIVGLDGQHHLHHSASRLLFWFIITFPNPVCESRLWVFALLDVAEITLHTERTGNKIH
jgi:hypothetical protein